MNLAPGSIPELTHVLWLCGAALVLLWAVTRPRLARQALHLVMSRPAYFVPAAMAVVGIAALTWAGGAVRATVQENPFDSFHGQLRLGLGWVGLGIVSAALAGLIGLLEAHSAGIKPGSDAFRAGFRRHVATIFLAKVLVAALCTVGSTTIKPDGRNVVLLVLCLVPSLLLAPVVGASARHPNRPIAALRDTFLIVTRDMWSVGRLVTAQAVLLVGLFVMWGRAHTDSMPVPAFSDLFYWDPMLLGHSSSALSFNTFPFVVGTTEPLASGLAVLVAAFGSTVFVAAHFLGATRGYTAPEPVDVGVEDLAGD